MSQVFSNFKQIAFLQLSAMKTESKQSKPVKLVQKIQAMNKTNYLVSVVELKGIVQILFVVGGYLSLKAAVNRILDHYERVF